MQRPQAGWAAPKRIGVVEDHGVVVAGLRGLIAAEPDLAITAAAPTVTELLDGTTELDLVILDLRLPDDSTPGANIAALRAVGIETLVFTSGDEPYLVREAARAEVLGVVRKSERDDTVLAAIRTAAAGRPVPTLDWAAAIDSDDELDEVGLSPQQRQVLALYASGESAARVGQLMTLTEHTVIAYLERIRKKYAEAGRPARSKTDLYKRAVEDGWLPVPRLQDRLRPGRRSRSSGFPSRPNSTRRGPWGPATT